MPAVDWIDYTVAVFDLLLILAVAGMKARLIWVMLTRTWDWTILGRGLLLMFMAVGFLFLLGGFGQANDIVTGDVAPAGNMQFVRWVIRLVLLAALVMIEVGFRRYRWPDRPSSIQWMLLLGFQHREKSGDSE